MQINIKIYSLYEILCIYRFNCCVVDFNHSLPLLIIFSFGFFWYQFKESFLRDQNCLPELIFSLDQDLLLNGECVFSGEGQIYFGVFLLPEKGKYA